MVSSYEYTTVEELEKNDIDYSAVDASYTDGVIEAVISQAERMVNSHTQTSFSGTIPDNVVYITIEISKKLMNNRLIKDGFNQDKSRELIKKIWDEEEYRPMLINKQSFYCKGYARELGI